MRERTDGFSPRQLESPQTSTFDAFQFLACFTTPNPPYALLLIPHCRQLPSAVIRMANRRVSVATVEQIGTQNYGK